MERIRAVYPLPSDDQTSEQGQDERSLGGPSDPLDPQEAPSEAPQSHRVNPLSSQEEAPAGSHPMGLMGHRGLQTPVIFRNTCLLDLLDLPRIHMHRSIEVSGVLRAIGPAKAQCWTNRDYTGCG